MKSYTTLLLFASCVLMMSCSAYHYTATYQHVPNDTKKGDLTIQAATGIEDISNVYTSYTVSDHIGVFLEHSCISSSFDDDTSYTVGNTTYHESEAFSYAKDAHISDVGGYYYNVVDFGKVHMTYAATAAYSYGKYNSCKQFYDLDMHRVFIQPSFCFSHNIVEIGMSARMSFVDYNVDMHTNEALTTKYDLHDVGEQPFWFFEPNIYAALGYKWVKIHMSFCIAHKLNDAEIDYKEGAVHLGLIVDLNVFDIFGKE